MLYYKLDLKRNEASGQGLEANAGQGVRGLNFNDQLACMVK